MEAYVYGGQQLYANVFNAIAILAGTDAIASFFRLILLIGLLVAVAGAALSMNLKGIFKWFLTSVMIFGAMIVPKTDVVIHDRVGPGAPIVVANVPLAVGFVFSTASTAGDRATQLMETAFGDPEIAQYSENGMIYASRIMTEMRDVRAPSEDQVQYIRSYVSNCVMYELLESRYTFTDLMDAENLLEFVTTTMPPNPARSGAWGTGASAEVKTCQEMASLLPAVLDAAAPEAASIFGRNVRPDFADALTASAVMADVAGAHQLLIGSSRDARDVFIQAMMINAVRDGVADFQAETGEQVSAYSTTRAELQMKNQNLFSARLSQKWIPYLRIILEIIFYAMFPLMAPFFMLPQMGPGLMKQYFSGFIMLQSWGPLFVILNKIMMEGAISETQAAAGRASADNTITLGNLDNVAAANGDLASIAGFMTMLIPVIASALAFGVHRLASQSESLLSSVNSGAAEAARDETVGNMNLGTSGYDLHRFNQEFGNQVGTSLSQDTGRSAVRSSEGGTFNVAANGRETYDGVGARSNLNMPIAASQAVGSELRQTAGEMASYSESQSQRAGESYTQAQDALHSWATNSSTGISSQLGERFAENADVREAASTIDALYSQAQRGMSSSASDERYLNAGAEGTAYGEVTAATGLEFLGSGGGVKAGARVSATAGTGQRDTEMTRAEFVESLSESERQDFARAEATILSAASSAEFTTTGSEGSSEARNVQEAMRSAETYSEEASRARSMSEQASLMAGRVESDSISWSKPLDDQLMEYYGNMMDGSGSLNRATPGWQGGFYDMYHNRPEEFDQMVEGFTATLVPNLENWDRAGAGVSGGADLAGASQSIAGGATLAGSVAAGVGAASADLRHENVGADEAVMDFAASRAAHVREDVGSPADQLPRGVERPDSFTDMRGVVNASRDAMDMPVFDRLGSTNVEETDRQNEIEANAARSGYLSGEAIGSPSVDNPAPSAPAPVDEPPVFQPWDAAAQGPTPASDGANLPNIGTEEPRPEPGAVPALDQTGQVPGAPPMAEVPNSSGGEPDEDEFLNRFRR